MSYTISDFRQHTFLAECSAVVQNITEENIEQSFVATGEEIDDDDDESDTENDE